MLQSFTVLIPTRERCETLVHALASVTAQDYDDLKIIVCDNMSADSTRDVVSAAGDPRVRYVNPGRRLSMTGNFEFSLAQVSHGFVMHLGDDDGLVPNAVATVARIIEETGVEAVTSSLAHYFWPNAVDQRKRGQLMFSRLPGYEIRRSADILSQVLRFERSYTELPGTYISFVDRRVIDRAMSGGRYYHSRTPDSYSGIVNAAVTDRFAYTGPPFAIAGISGRSNGGQQLSGNADMSEARAYEVESDIAFDERVAFAPSIELIVAEAFLQARKHISALGEQTIDMDRLAEIALREASPATWESVRKAVAETRYRNGLRDPGDTPANTGKPASFRRRALASKLRRGLLRARRRYQIVDAGAFGVYDIAGAGQLAATLLTSTTLGNVGFGAELRRWFRRL